MSEQEPIATKKSSAASPAKLARSAKRQEHHRRERGNEFQKEYKAKLELKYSLDTVVSSKIVHTSTSSVPIPASTRGIGFGIVNQFSAARARNIPLHVSTPLAYRVSHAQLYLKAAMLRPAYLDPPEMQAVATLPIEYDMQQATSLESNLTLVSEIINSYGNIEKHQCNYRTRLLSPPILPLPNNPGQSFMLPDPFNVNFKNLSDIVDSLSNPHVPDQDRLFFRLHNPIPGALWDENNLLTNPEEIWPENYDAAALSEEMRLYSGMLSLMKQKMPKWVGKVDSSPQFLGKSNAVATLTKHSAGTWRIEKIAPAHPDMFRAEGKFSTSSPICLDGIDLLMANVTLLGECPPDCVLQAHPNAYAARDFRAHGQTAEYIRAGLVDQILYN